MSLAVQARFRGRKVAKVSTRVQLLELGWVSVSGLLLSSSKATSLAG